ncbi:MAG: ADP-ribosylglycohydrolase family protein [Lachnospiraceae bacterium]|nr:ADP-ribosylglycohydrolase family protein [Lachnospiraceae bacterium]
MQGKEIQELKNHIKGAFIGIAYGDAFGMPGEMWTPEIIHQKLGTVNEFRCGHRDNSISAKLKRGEVTDDTINSLLVLEMLCANHGKVDAAIFIEKLDEWIRTSNKSAAVVGPSTAKAIELIRSGVPMEETGKNGTTNGGAMKILPVGLACGLRAKPELRELAEEVAKLCMPTHGTSSAISAACAIAAGGALAVYGEKNINSIIEFMQEAAVYGERYGYTWGGPSVAGRMKMGKYFADHYPETEALSAIYTYVGTGISSTESIPAAAALFYLAKGNPGKCARYAANIGGDTDTIGAMACGICGAYSGADAFDPEEVMLLENVNDISFGELTEKIMNAVRV